MDIGWIMMEQKLRRIKRLLDAEVKIDALVSLLVSKGIITEGELAVETASVKSTEKYDFDVYEADANIKVFSAMLDTCVKKEGQIYGPLNEDDTLKDLQEATQDETK